MDQRATAKMLTQSIADPRVGSFDVAFLALHGGTGEDGTVQTLLGLAGVKYTGSGPLTSGVAMHKDTTKRLFRHAGIPTPDWIYPLRNGDDPFGNLGCPVIVKPVAEGSTVGLTLLKDAKGLPEAIRLAGGEPMVERFIPGRELSVGILGGRALPPVEIIPKHEIYDYECKYTDGMSLFVCPAELESGITDEVCGLAARAFDVLGCKGYARIDFRLSPDKVPFCLEVNTLPGMTSHSLVPMAAKVVGMDFPTLCEQICELALKG
jgi:D-alanine-D-alanine ligase